MSERYYLKHRDITIGAFVRSDNDLTYLPNIPQADKLPTLLGYPPGIFSMDRTKTPWTVNKKKVGDSESITNWLIRRIFSKERPDLQNLLKCLGLDEYDPWEIVKKTKGVTKNDNFWITQYEEDNFKKSVLDDVTFIVTTVN